MSYCKGQYLYRSRTQCSLEQPKALRMMAWSEGVWDAMRTNNLSHVSERDSRIPVHITRDLTSGGILQVHFDKKIIENYNII